MAEIMKMPAIRFKGFSEEWEEKQIADLCSETTGGGTPKTTESRYWNGDTPWLQSSDLVENQLSSVVYRKTITEHGLKSSATKLVPADSIAIVTRVGVGKLALIPYAYSTSQDFLSLSYLKVDKWFGAYSIWKKIQSELHAVQGTSIKGITKEELLSKKTLIAKETNEQTPIGSYFQNIDKLISLHQAKVNKLVNLKKAMLEKMFPQDGADVPEIRFKGFTGGWEEKALGEVFDDFKGTGLSKEKIASQGKNKCILYGHLFTKFSEVISKIDSRTDYEEGVLSKKNDILMPSSTTTKGIDLAKASSLKESGVLLGGDIIILRMKELGSSDFFAYYLTHGVNKKIAEVTQGTTIIHLYFSGLRDLHLKVPCPAEQIQIGTYFQNLDKLISLHQTELEKLNNLKKACLEQMFV